MDSRMNKYTDDKKPLSRVSRNEELYKEINNSELDNFSVRSNATVLGKQEQEIDIDKIKKILDTKYKDNAPKRKSIRIEEDSEETVVREEATKEYDLNVFLEKAKDDKEETYEEARAKKLRDTQFDILNNLNIEKKDNKDNKEDVEEDLLNLINTITINETKKDEVELLDGEFKSSNETEDEGLADIFEDLKPSENTEVYEGIKDEIEKIETSSKVMDKNNSLDKSFYTEDNMFKKKDFLENENDADKMSIWIKILIFLVIVSFLIGLFLFFKSYLNI